MHRQIRLIIIFFVAFILLVDGIVSAGLLQDFQVLRNPVFPGVYWFASLAYIAALLIYGRAFLADNRPGFFAGFYVFTGIFLALYVPKLFYAVFLLLEWLVKLLSYPLILIFSGRTGFTEGLSGGTMDFISMIVLPISLLAFILILWGMLFGRFNFRVRQSEVVNPDLPPAFDGFRIVHISDLHLGSLYGQQAKIRKAIDMINRESPDLIAFTGDLVNNLAGEADGWTGLLSEMRSRHGKFSILGNHDYGEYYHWQDEASRTENMEALFSAHRDSGFGLLLNRSERISLDGQEIFLSGVENWGLPPFKQYGDLDKALRDVPEKAFTVLLSHDPSHWDEEVLGKTGVHLTLSGHTHGMQFGIRMGRIRWSPVQWKYPRWIGLYRQGSQYLHVNPGLGYIGYAGRILIPPEISVITLRRSVQSTAGNGSRDKV
jgi:predicted MPP superfamily phosphohydrolase